jgi:hypothetical protein
MPRTTRLGRRFVLAGPLAVAVLATPFFAPLVSAADAAPITLASASDGRTLQLGDIAADELIVVGFQERNVSYMRWSKNLGKTFAAKVALHGGLAAKDPHVATCNDILFAVSSWQTATTTEIGVDYRDLVTGDNGTYSLGPGDMSDVACYGDLAAVTWVHDGHAWLSARPFDCSDPCADVVTIDLGTGDFSSPPQITGDYAGFSVAWLTTGLAIQQFDYGNSGGNAFTLTAHPVLTLMAGKGVSAPLIGGLGQSVVVAYQRAGRIHIRLSDDVANTFGPAITVPGACSSCTDGGPRPVSVDIAGSTILIEVNRPSGSPSSYLTKGFVTTDSGMTWAKLSSRKGGSQSGVLVNDLGYAETWDRHLSAKPDQFIRFQGSHL